MIREHCFPWLVYLNGYYHWFQHLVPSQDLSRLDYLLHEKKSSVVHHRTLPELVKMYSPGGLDNEIYVMHHV